jgi:hypothetical protein
MDIPAPWHFARPALASQYLDLLTAGPIQSTAGSTSHCNTWASLALGVM